MTEVEFNLPTADSGMPIKGTKLNNQDWYKKKFGLRDKFGYLVQGASYKNFRRKREEDLDRAETDAERLSLVDVVLTGYCVSISEPHPLHYQINNVVVDLKRQDLSERKRKKLSDKLHRLYREWRQYFNENMQRAETYLQQQESYGAQDLADLNRKVIQKHSNWAMDRKERAIREVGLEHILTDD